MTERHVTEQPRIPAKDPEIRKGPLKEPPSKEPAQEDPPAEPPEPGEPEKRIEEPSFPGDLGEPMKDPPIGP